METHAGQAEEGLTTTEIARLLGRSLEMTRRWLRQGVIPGVKRQSATNHPVWAVEPEALAQAAPRIAQKRRRRPTRRST